jgi:hypothetical protein
MAAEVFAALSASAEAPSPWLVLALLHAHPGAGHQQFLCEQLSRCAPGVVADVLPQLCHMLVVRPSGSAALQAFLAGLCTRSRHAAAMLLWLLDATLADLADNYESPDLRADALPACIALYRRCHALALGDTAAAAESRGAAPRVLPPPVLLPVPDPTGTPVPATAGAGAAPLRPGRAHTLLGTAPAIALGMGVVAAAAAGAPWLAASHGALVLEHARSVTIVEDSAAASSPVGSLGLGAAAATAAAAAAVAPTDSAPPLVPAVGTPPRPLILPRGPPTVEDLHYGRAFSMPEYADNTCPALYIYICAYTRSLPCGRSRLTRAMGDDVG